MTTLDNPPAKTHEPRALRRGLFFRNTVYFVYFAPVVLLLLIGLKLPSVMTSQGLLSLMILSAVLGIAAVGQTWAIIIAGIDLSIPAVIGLACVVVTVRTLAGASFLSIVLWLVAFSLVVGVINGTLTSLLKVHPLVITLGVGAIVTGAVLLATGGNTGGLVPDFVTSAVSPIGKTGFIPLPPAVSIWIAISVLVLVIERRTSFGRRLFALGSNPRAAGYALIRATVVRIGVYTASALCASIAGVLLAGFSGAAAADIGVPYMFKTLMAVVVGGTSLLGGRGSYSRTIAGVLLTTEFTMLLIGFSIDASLQQVFLGVAILILIAIYGRDRHVAQRL
ncbi:ABC transporter permease [Sphaerisporangium sp. NPDC051011]|uniref:ABC transporter permease n=1 Tax=Sphaerisporangium sp. NPDC051011 TaxID=3155792 RepID=UPI0033D65702